MLEGDFVSEGYKLLPYDRYQARTGEVNQGEVKKLSGVLESQTVAYKWDCRKELIDASKLRHGRIEIGSKLAFDVQRLALGMMASAEKLDDDGQSVVRLRYPHQEGDQITGATDLSFTTEQFNQLQKLMRSELERQGILEPRSGHEFNFAEVNRPFTLEDVVEFQRQFRAFNQSNQAQGGKYRIGESQFYEYLSSGSFWGAERNGGQTPETLTDEGRQGYNDLLISTYQGWRENLIKNKDNIAKVRPEVIKQFGDLTQLPNPQTADEVRDLYAANPKLNELSAASYQEGLVKGVINNDFLHFSGHRYNGYEYEKPKTEIRLYTNPPINEVPKLAQEFVEIANARGIPYYFKMIDFSLQEPLPESLKRVDRMLFYSDKVNAPKIAGILEELKSLHPNWFKDRPLPPMTAKIMEGVGVAEEPTEDQHKKFHPYGSDNTSFNGVRAKFLDKLWVGVMKNIIRQSPGLKPRGGRDLKRIFSDTVSSEDRQYLDGLLRSNLNPPADDRNAQRVLDDALRKMMVDVVPNFTPDTLLPWLNRGSEILGPEFGIDPNNLAFNKAA